MKILYDYQTFCMQTFGGISRYFYKLMKYNQNLWICDIAGKYANNIYIKELFNKKTIVPFHFKGKGRIENIFNSMDLIKKLKEEFDVYHPTYYFTKNLPKSKPVVVTAHDFIHERFPEELQDNKTIAAKKNILNKADKIIAISNKTKEDLLVYYPEISETKIDVVYHAIEWEKRPPQKLELDLPSPYILYTGTRHNYKNFIFFIKAISKILTKENLFLICTGNPFTKYEADMISSLGISERIIRIFADEQQLRLLYENALCFVFPSKYEGFGLPILESWVSRCPILLSNASCFPEIAKDSALYFDPKSEIDFTNQLMKIIQSRDLRNQLISKGYERFDLFSMARMIYDTLSVYEKAGS